MLAQLINLVKENAGYAIINNNDIPNENNDAVIQTTAHGIMDHFKNLLGNGDAENISNLLQQGNGSQVSTMASNIAEKIASKFGIDQTKADGIVKNLVSMVMGSLSKKTNDPNDDSFTMQGILGSLTSSEGGLGGIMDSFKKMF